jgi:hypothetical protein
MLEIYYNPVVLSNGNNKLSLEVVVVFMKKYPVLLLCFFLPLGLLAQNYANEFLYLGTGARSLALGQSTVAGTEGLAAAYENPAGLVRMTSSQVIFTHGAFYGNMAGLDFIAYGRVPREGSAVAVSLLRFGVDNIMNTTRLIDESGTVDYNRITYFSAADYALMLTFSCREIRKGLDGGVTFKILYRHVGKFASGFGLGMDAGLQYHLNKWRFGLLIRDITATHVYWSFDRDALEEIRNAVPGTNLSEPRAYEISLPRIRTGIARRFDFDNYSITAEMDLTHYFYPRYALISSDYYSMEPSLGLEGGYKNKIFLRMGINGLYATEYFGARVWRVNPSAGLGVRFKYLDLDYAFVNMLQQGLNGHVISLKLDLRIFKKS